MRSCDSISDEQLISSHPIPSHKTGSLYLHLLSFDFHVIEMHQCLSMFTRFSLMTSSWNSSMLLPVLSLFLSYNFSFIFSFPNIFRFQTLSTSVYILSWEAMVLVERFKLEWISMARLSFYNMKPCSNKPAIRGARAGIRDVLDSRTSVMFLRSMLFVAPAPHPLLSSY